MQTKSNQDTIRQWANLIAILTAFGTNVLANILPLKGLSIGEIANTFFRDVLIIPANYAFAIWGLIYLGLISLAVYQALPTNRNHPHLRRMGYLLVISSVAQIAWVYFFQSRLFLLSLIAMVVILVPLIVLYQRLNFDSQPISQAQKWLVNIPLSIYLAWISVATIVNVAIALYDLDWNGGGISPQIWTVLMLLVGAILAVIVSFPRADVAYAGVFIWALVAIAVRHFDTLIIAGTAVGLAILLALFMFWRKQSQGVRISPQKNADSLEVHRRR